MTKTYEVMKLEASSYPTTVDVVTSEFVSEYTSSTTGNVVDPPCAAFATFLALLCAFFFFCFFDNPTLRGEDCVLDTDTFVEMPLAEYLCGAGRDNAEMADDISSSGRVNPSEAM